MPIKILPEPSLLPSLYDVCLTAPASSFQALTYKHFGFRTHKLIDNIIVQAREN